MIPKTPLAVLTTGLLTVLLAQEPAPPRQGPLWLVTFKQRSFDLTAYRAAIRARQHPEQVQKIVRQLDAAMRKDQEPFVGFVAGLGGRVEQQYWIVNGCAVRLPKGRVDALRRHPRVRWVHADAPVRAGRVPRLIGTSTDANNHRAQALHGAGITGRGATIAILDSGLDMVSGTTGRPHRTFFDDGDPQRTVPGGIGGSRVLANLAVGTRPAEDVYGHGTAVAAVAAGEVWNNSALAAPGHAPDARIVGISVATDDFGRSSLATLQLAWQALARDRAKYGIVVANNSYTGSSDPSHPSQQALDAVAHQADVLVVVAAGNHGAKVFTSQAALNGLAVGAVGLDRKQVAAFSARGPAHADPGRSYPDMVAAGVNVVMPIKDFEASSRPDSGTSYAAPQVAGAACLFRALAPSRSALETKAALLVSTQDVRADNPGPGDKGRNALGMGYLRDDLLVSLAQGTGQLTEQVLSAQQPERRIKFSAHAGQTYAAVITWHRRDPSENAWSDLDLVLRDSRGRLLAASSSRRNLYEKLIHTATRSETLELTVSGVALEPGAETFALALLPTAAQTRTGAFVAQGPGCPGSYRDRSVKTVIPSSYASQFGYLAIDDMSWPARRVQYIFDAAQMPQSFRADGFALRPHRTRVSTPLKWWVELQLDLSYTSLSPLGMSAYFAQNITGTPTRVIRTRRFDLPVLPGPNTDVGHFQAVLPFDQPYHYAQQAGGHLLFDKQILGTAQVNPTDRYVYDGFIQYPAVRPAASRLYAPRGTARGTQLPGAGPVLGFSSSDPQGVVPQLSATGHPDLGRPVELALQHARPSASGMLIFGRDELRLDLGMLGASGCTLYNTAEALFPIQTDAMGGYRLQLTLPTQAGLVASTLHQQIMVVDPGRNALGVSMSNGLSAVVGGR